MIVYSNRPSKCAPPCGDCGPCGPQCTPKTSLSVVGTTGTYTDECGKVTTFSVGGGGGGPVTFPDLNFAQITPTQLTALGTALQANGGFVLNDAFGVPQGVMFPV